MSRKLAQPRGRAGTVALAVFVLLSIAPSLAAAEDYTCDAIGRVPKEQRCAFVTANCTSESIIPYSQWYHCGVARHNALLRGGYVLLVATLIPLCFCLLGDTAEFYFSPIMAHVSQSIPKMRPRFAGVTFVALGNGAPDLSANVAAIQSGEVLLSAGGITGAAMFVQCIVAAELIAMSPNGVKCAGAMTRDVAVYAVAISSVLLAFALGVVNHAFVGWAFSLYVVYAIWVFAGDEWHERGRPDLRQMRDHLTRGREDLEGPLLTWAAADDENGPPIVEKPQAATSPPPRSAAGLPPAGSAVSPSPGGLVFGAPASPEPWDGPGSLAADGATGEAAGSRAAGEWPQGGEQQQQQQQREGRVESFSVAQSEQRRPRRTWDGGNPSPPRVPPALSGGRGGSSFTAGAPAVGIPIPSATRHRGVGSSSFGRQGSGLGESQQQYIDARTYRQLVWADLANDAAEGVRIVEEQREREAAAAAEADAEAAAAAATGGGYRPPASYEEFPTLSPRTASPDSTDGRVAGGSFLSPVPPGGRRQWSAASDGIFASARSWLGGRASSALSAGSGGEFAGLPPVVTLVVAAAQGRPNAGFALWHLVRREVTMRNCEEWDDGPKVIRAFRRVTFPLLLPVYCALRSTIPFAIPPGYSRPWLIASLAAWPLGICSYLGALHSAAAFGTAAGAGAAAAAAVWWLTRGDAPHAPPLSDMAATAAAAEHSEGGDGGDFSVRVRRTAAAALPGAFSVLGFFMGVAWIDTVAGEVVGALSFLAALAGLPAGVVGLTLLAWGNSLGDFFGNRAMARAGHASIATTACFAAPLFNMLMSLSLGFGGRLAKLGVRSVAVSLTPEVALGCGFLVVYDLVLIAVGRMFGRLPRWFATFARVWYALYFVVACASGFGLLWRR